MLKTKRNKELRVIVFPGPGFSIDNLCWQRLSAFTARKLFLELGRMFCSLTQISTSQQSVVRIFSSILAAESNCFIDQFLQACTYNLLCITMIFILRDHYLT